MITLFCLIVFGKLPTQVMPLWVYLVLVVLEVLLLLAKMINE